MSVPASATTGAGRQVWTTNDEFSDSRGKLVSADGKKGAMDPEGEWTMIE